MTPKILKASGKLSGKTFGLLAIAAVMLGACGGGQGPLLSGVFLDSPVVGMTYSTPTTSGVTEEGGAYNYRQGETIVFSIGQLVLPVVVASEVITPLDMGDGGGLDDDSVINILRLLQSLDSDADPSNGIDISEQTADTFSETEIFDTDDESALQEKVAMAFEGERDVVSALVAESHFIETLSARTDSVANLSQLQYLVAEGETYDGDTLFVDTSGFSLTLDGQTNTGATVVHEGVYQLLGEEQEWFVSVAGTDEDRRACITSMPRSVAECDNAVYQIFTDEEQALNSNREISDNSDLDIGAATAEENGAEEDVATENAETANAVNSEEPEIAASEVAEASAAATETEQAGVDAAEPTLEELFPACSPNTDDSDGDGFGWQDNQSCLITASQTDAEESVPGAAAEESVAEEATETTEAATVFQPSDITDIIVLTGQSNAAAVQTAYDAVLDAGHERVFAFVEGGQWQTADLYQSWDAHLPSNYASVADGREPFNNLAFQLGKSLANKTDRVVGIVMLTAPGEGISHWDYGSEFYNLMRSKVTSALSLLPNKNSIDAIIWAQGETDWLFEGTADPGATGFASWDTEEYRNYYPNKLTQLVSNLRSELWFEEAKFICSETKKADLNPHLMALNHDDDNLTACAQASDLPTRDSDPYGNHFSADGLRTLADRIAEIYLSNE